MYAFIFAACTPPRGQSRLAFSQMGAVGKWDIADAGEGDDGSYWLMQMKPGEPCGVSELH